MKWNVKMSGRFGRGEHKVNIECRKSDKDAPYSRRKVKAFKPTRWRSYIAVRVPVQQIDTERKE